MSQQPQEASTAGLCFFSPLVLGSAVLSDIKTNRDWRNEAPAPRVWTVRSPRPPEITQTLTEGRGQVPGERVPCQHYPSPCRREHRPARNCLQNIRQKTRSASSSPPRPACAKVVGEPQLVPQLGPVASSVALHSRITHNVLNSN